MRSNIANHYLRNTASVGTYVDISSEIDNEK
jgi:hypothetical protein